MKTRAPALVGVAVRGRKRPRVRVTVAGWFIAAFSAPFRVGAFLCAPMDLPRMARGKGDTMSTALLPFPPCDRETFNEVVAKEWENFVSAVVHKMYIKDKPVVNRADAENIVQVALVNAWQKRHTYQAVGPLVNWLAAFVRWEFRGYWKDRTRRYETWGETYWLETLAANNTLPPAPNCPTSDEMLEKEAERTKHRAQLGRLLNGISKIKRQTIVKRHFRGMSISEIAKEKSANYSTIVSRFFLGNQQLRQLAKDLAA